MKNIKEFVLESNTVDIDLECPYCGEVDGLIIKKSTKHFINTCPNCNKKYNVILHKNGGIQYELLDK